MKKYQLANSTLFIVFFVMCQLTIAAKTEQKLKGEIYQLKVYHFKNTQQLTVTEAYLKTNFLPALHQLGLQKIGVFTAINNDTAVDKKLFVLIPFSSLQQLENIYKKIDDNTLVNQDATGYVNAAYNMPPYERIESIILKSFNKMPTLEIPQLTSANTERVYELRSYEAATEKLYQQKVKMFNAGGEIALFKRLNFNAVFYAEVLSGSRMPNLMYMTTFKNQTERDAHWKIFGADAEWKTLSALPEYQHTVSKSDIFFLRPTSYSDY